MSKQTTDVSRHLASRRAVEQALKRHKVIVSSKSYGQGGVTTRVLIGGEYYDVDNHQLDLLEMGRTPADLFLRPVFEH